MELNITVQGIGSPDPAVSYTHLDVYKRQANKGREFRHASTWVKTV